MIAHPLPSQDTHLDLFYKSKKDNEHLGIASFQKNELNFETLKYLPRVVDNFFKYGIHATNIEELFHTNISKFRNNLEGYTKLCWLASDYFNNNYKFKNLIGVKYNPKLNVWDIHPGGSRQVILKYFGPDEIQAIAFNTGGIKRKFDIIFNDKIELQNFFKKDIMFICSTEHGSIIPHLHFDQALLTIKTIEWAIRVQKFWRDTHVIGPFNKSIIYHKSTHKKKTLRLTLENNNDYIKGLVLLPLYNNYSFQGIKIEEC